MPNFDQSDAAPGGPETLPEPLPADPLPLFEAWFDEALERRLQPNPNAMTVATLGPQGELSARIVLCKGYDLRAGYVEFYTNGQSRKGAALAANPRAALLFHWDALDRQIRIEGPVSRVPPAKADEYFASRHPLSRVGAWASAQSEPIGSRDAFDEKVRAAAARFGVDLAAIAQPGAPDVAIPRPAHWGGWRVWAERVELWIGRAGRIHDRALWTRELRPTGDEDLAFSAAGDGAWRVSRLQP